MFCKHLCRIDSDKQTATARQYLSLFVQDLRHIHVLAPAHRALASLDYQTLSERDELQIFHLHRLGDGDHRAQLIDLAHGLIEDGRDDASMGMPRRPLEAQRQTKAAERASARLVEVEFQVHALRIVGPASKTVILVDADVFNL